MAITKKNNTVKPATIKRCKKTGVRATGTATAQAKTKADARKEAWKEATKQRDLAIAKVKKLDCPKFGGCKNPCQKRGKPVLTGFGDNTSRKKIKGGWEVRVRRWRSFDIRCKCPRG